MTVKKYHHTFSAQLALIFVLTQIVVASGVYAWQDYARVYFAANSPLQILVPLLILQSIACAVVVSFARRPVKKIDDALTYAYRNANAKQESIDSLTGLVKSIRHLDALTNSKAEPVRAEHEFAQSLLDHLPVGIIALGAKREVIYANAAAPMHGGGKEINLDFKEHDSLDTWLSQVSEKNISASHWWRRLGQTAIENEESRHFFDCLALYRQGGDDSIETILIVIDRSDQYLTDEDELDFMALASHELRGPITVIRGYVDVLKTELEKNLTEDQRAFFERLDVSADRLSTYINNILNVSRFDRRHLQLNLKEETVEKIYSTVSDDLMLRARTQHRLLNIHIPKDLPTIAADRDSLCEVVINLIDNAIKYSSEGGVIVASAKAEGEFVEFSVQDSGIGIPGSLIAHVFDKFYRSHRSRENTVGTGLGLYIAKAIVESHGGSISVRSEDGHGSTFSFTVPTYASVADKLLSSNNSNAQLIKPKEFIKNHSLYRG
jgi:signal transduction histidine kinase